MKIVHNAKWSTLLTCFFIAMMTSMVSCSNSFSTDDIEVYSNSSSSGASLSSDGSSVTSSSSMVSSANTSPGSSTKTGPESSSSVLIITEEWERPYCPSSIGSSTEQVAEKLANCRQLFSLHRNALIQFDAIEVGFASSNKRYWLSGSKKDSTAVLDSSLTLVLGKSYPTYQDSRENPILQKYDEFIETLCENNETLQDGKNVCYQIVEASFDSITGMPLLIDIEFVVSPVIDVDGNDYYVFTNTVWDRNVDYSQDFISGDIILDPPRPTGMKITKQKAGILIQDFITLTQLPEISVSTGVDSDTFHVWYDAREGVVREYAGAIQVNIEVEGFVPDSLIIIFHEVDFARAPTADEPEFRDAREEFSIIIP